MGRVRLIKEHIATATCDSQRERTFRVLFFFLSFGGTDDGGGGCCVVVVVVL